MKINRPGFLVGCLLILISCGVYYSFGGIKPELLSALDYRVMDMMFKTRGASPVSGQVVIVDIDEKSLQKIGQWPWPRNVLADLTHRLKKNGVRAVGFDIVFAEKDRMSPAAYFKNLDKSLSRQIPSRVMDKLVHDKSLDYDGLFGRVLAESPSVLGYAFQLVDDGLKNDTDVPFPTAVIRINPPKLDYGSLPLISAYRAIINHPDLAMAQSEGFFNVFSDDAGTTRRVPMIMMMDHIPYPSLALETFRIGMGYDAIVIHASRKIKTRRPPVLGLQLGKQFIPTDSFGQIFVNYRGPSRTFKYISAADILSRDMIPEVKDKFVMIGTSSTGLHDLKTTPFSNAIAGVEINANIIDNLILADAFSFDRYTEIGLTYFFIITGGLLLSFLLAVLGPLAGSIGAVALFSGAVLLNYYYFFLNQRHIGIFYPLFTCAVILLVTSIFNAVKERKTKRYIKKAFSHYVSKDVVHQLIRHPGSLSLKGEEKQLTVLFCDIRGFTSLSETMTSQDLGEFMNDYLTRMSRIIMDHQGTVDKFIGDAIMAFWGAPRPDDRHAQRAVAAALEMRAMIENPAAGYDNRGLPKISIGIGINSGLMSVGNFGSNERFDYTVMGDNVNLASRLEGANKNYGTTILISSETRQMIRDDFFCRYIDKVQVKGRQKPVDIYEPLFRGKAPPEVLTETKLFEEGVAAYQTHQFLRAKKIMTGLYQKEAHLLYLSYLDRIEAFLSDAPPEKWDGTERREKLPVNRLLEK